MLKDDFRDYAKAINTSDFDKQLKYIPNFVYDSISKEKLLAVMKRSVTEDESTIKLDSIFEIDSIITDNKKKYSRINIAYDIVFDLSEYKGKDEMNYAVSMTHKSLLKEYGNDNVKFNKENLVFNIKWRMRLYGIKEDNWTFTDLNELTEPHIPKEIIVID